MRAGWRTPLLVVALISAGQLAHADRRSHRNYAGLPLTEALEDLRSKGLDIIYSSDLVRREMRVLAEPVATTPRGILEDLIAPHGLEVRDGPGGALLVVAGEPGAGPTGGIAGRVVSGSDKRPAAGALVSVPGTSVSVSAAADGRFLIPRLTPGTWPMDVRSADGRMQQTVDISVKAGQVIRVAIELAPAPTLIEGVVVTPTRRMVAADEPDTRRSVQGEELDRLAHLGGDAQRAAARLPGVVTGDKSARFNLRGGEWDEVLVVLDGLEIDQPFHLKDFLASSGLFDSQAIERIDLIPGGFPVEYGGRMSGVMELSSTIPERPVVSVGSGLPNSRALVQGRTDSDKARWLAAARTWYPDAVFDLVDPGGEAIHPSYSDLLGKVEFHLDGGTTISGHALAARDLVDFNGQAAGERARARYDTSYAWINVESPWTPRLFSSSQISIGRLDSSRAGGSGARPEGTSQVDDARFSSFVGAKQDWIFRASDRYLLKWGADARILDAHYEYSSHVTIDDPIFTPPMSPLVVDRHITERPSGHSLGVYAAGKTKLSPRLTMELGLRWDERSYTSEARIDPRANLVWTQGERDTIRAAWGLFHQFQRIDELQVEDGVRDFFPAQLSEHRLISFEHRSEAGYHFRADAYWNEMSHLRPRFENLFNPIELFPEGESDRVRIAPRRATARGIELTVSRQPSEAVSWWAGYALALAQDEIGGRSEPRSWDQRHAVNLGLGYRFGPGWEVDVSGAWHSGWPTTRVDASWVTDPNGMVTILPVLGPRNAERFPPYHRMDLKLTRRIPMQGSVLIFSLEVLNLYNRENACCIDDFVFHPQPGGSVRVERQEDFSLQRFPSFGITWEF